MNNLNKKDKLKQEKENKKKDELEKITEEISKAVDNQFDFLTSDETPKSEKIKEYTRLAIFLPTMLIPKILILIKFGLPAYIISKIFFGYLGLAPDNSETDNKTIKAINSKTGMNFLLKNRPIFYREMRKFIQEKAIEKFDKYKEKTKKIIRV